MNQKILIVEDEPAIQELLVHALRKEGYLVEAVASGENALAATRDGHYSLVLLDVMLPGIDGMEVCRRLKTDPVTESIAIIFLSAKSEEADIMSGLEMGAVNYITKPFKLKTLISMIRAVLRFVGTQGNALDAEIHFNSLVLHPGKHEVRYNGLRINLTLTEFGIMKLLMKRPGWVHSRHKIIDSVHGTDHLVTDRSVDIQILNLRRKLGDAGRYIETVRGIGYRFTPDD